MEDSRQDLPKSKDELTKIILPYKVEIDRLNEIVSLLRHALFGPKSEKLPAGESPQLSLFDLPEDPPAEEDDSKKKEIFVPGHTRKKKGRKPLPENLPRVDVVHDIPEEEKICACGCQLSKIGEDISEKLDIVPAKMQVIRHIRPKYACKGCEGLEDSQTVKIAPPPAQIIPKGLATAGLLAHILTGKFCDALPFYRQEKQFIRIGVDIPRQSMCNWAMKAAEACQPLMNLLLEDVRGGPLINADETTVQVLKEPGRKATQKSYMWVFRGGKIDNPIVVYQYNETRANGVPKLFFNEYQGVVQTDGYVSYNFLDNWLGIIHVGCWAHARRKFMDIKKGSPGKKNDSADKAIAYIRKLYTFERYAKSNNLSPEDIHNMRQEHAKPVLGEMKIWLDKKKEDVPPKSLLGKAIRYCLNQWRRLENYIKDGHAKIDNNVAENAIRPFVLGRKNWLFSGTPAGARASALLFSLIETAKANKLEPFSYLRYLFEKLPVTSTKELRTLLPTNLLPEDLLLPGLVSGV